MNFQTIVKEIQAAGYTQSQIAKQCNCAQATISDLLTGAITDPRYSTVEPIQALHRLVMRKVKREAAKNEA